MERRTAAEATVLGALVAVGLAVSGWFIGNGLLAARSSDRYVSVRGFAEREVAANLAIWPMVYTVTADDLETLQRRVEDGAAKIMAFLEADFSAAEITTAQPRVTDREAMGMTGPGGTRLERYMAEAIVTVRTGKIAEVQQAMQRSGELVKRGVALIRSYEYNTEYLYTDLDKVKPEMIAEATRDARRAAQQFAEDSGSRVGGIRNAQQGYFSIENRDAFSPQFKKIRVVTTVQYFLVDD